MNKLITITEALAELKTVDSKIGTTKDFLVNYAIRQGSTIDPLDDEGGSDVVMAQKMQSLRDLLGRKVSIRIAINNKNATTSLVVCGITKTVAEWIVWRREVYAIEKSVYAGLHAKVLDARKQCIQKGLVLKEDGTQPSKVTEVSSFIKEIDIVHRIEQLNGIDTTLDGKLSLINATTVVEV